MQPNNKTKALYFGNRANPPKLNLQLPWLHPEGKASKQTSKNTLFSSIAFLEGNSQTKPSPTSPWFETIPEQEIRKTHLKTSIQKKARALVWPHPNIPNSFKEKNTPNPKINKNKPVASLLSPHVWVGLTGELFQFFSWSTRRPRNPTDQIS